MATPGGGTLRVYDRDLLDEVLGSPKVRACVAKPPSLRASLHPRFVVRIREPRYPPSRFSPSDRSPDPRSPDPSPQNPSREPSKLRRSYDEDAAFAVGDEDLSSEDGSDAEGDADASAVVRDADDAFAVRDDDEGEASDGRPTAFTSEDEDDGSSEGDDVDASSDAASVSNDDDDDSASDASDDDSVRDDHSSRGDVDDPRVAAGAGLTKSRWFEKKTADENARRFFQTEEAREAAFRAKAAAASRANAAFEQMLGDVERGLGAGGVVARGDDSVYRREAALAKKHAEIHEEWEERIFRALQRQIKTHVDAVDPEDLSRSLRRNAREYAETVSRKQRSNPKAGVFLDATLGYEYDPAARARDRAAVVTVNSLRDPTKRDVYKPVRERIEAGRVRAARALATTRATTKDVLAQAFWNALEYTPHGRYTDADGELLPADAAIPGFFTQGQEKWNQHSEGNARDDYAFPVGEAGFAAARREYFEAQRGGARKARMGFNAAPEDVDGGTRTTLGLVHQTDMLTQGDAFARTAKTGGDAFLERKGRARRVRANGFAPGLSPTRPDLFGVMRGEGARDGYPRGDKDDLAKQGHRDDAWYATRGKACFEELAVQKSARKGLYQVLQGGGAFGDSGNPAGQNVGDAWLDTKLKDPVFAVDGRRYGSRYSGDAQGDLYGQLSHTHALSEHPTKPVVDPPDPMFERMQRLNAAADDAPRAKRHVQQYVTQL